MSEEETIDTKICPFCAETIKLEAVVCRFCNRELLAANKTQAAKQMKQDKALQQLPNKMLAFAGLGFSGCLMMMAVPFILFFICLVIGLASKGH